MKRSEMLKLIANQLDFLNGTFEGVRDNFTEEELAKADVILTTIEEAGMQPPPIRMYPNTWIRSTGEYGWDAYEWEEETLDIQEKLK